MEDPSSEDRPTEALGEGEATSARPNAKLAPGTDVGGYIVEEELGRGGMGVVYRATHPVIGKRVAIKVLRPDLAEHDQALAIERFTQEARSVNQIGHPNIVDIFGFGTMPDGRVYLMMDLLDGEPLRKRVKRGPLHVSEAASIVDETASALLAVHEKGFIHRDLKPDNVFLVGHDGRWPEVKLLDFGLAKLLPQGGIATFRTKTGILLGTPDYMAPELVRKRGEIDHRVDLYALGVMTFEMLTGRRPFPGPDGSFEKLQRICETPAPPLRSLAPHVPEELAAIVDALLDKDPDKRPTLVTVRAVIKRLRGTLLPSMSVVAMEAVDQTMSDAPAVSVASPTPMPSPAPATTPLSGPESLAGVTVRVGAQAFAGAQALAGDKPGLPTEPLLPTYSNPLFAAPAPPAPAAPPTPAISAPGLVAPGAAASSLTELGVGVQMPPRARSQAPVSVPAMRPETGLVSTQLGVNAPLRPSRSAVTVKPARMNPAWVLLVILGVLGGILAAAMFAMR